MAKSGYCRAEWVFQGFRFPLGTTNLFSRHFSYSNTLTPNGQLKPIGKHQHQARKGRLGVHDVKYAILVDVGKGSPYQHAAFDVALPRLWVN